MAGQAVDGNLFLRQNVHADFQRRHGGIELGPEEIGQGEAGVRTSGDQGTARVHVGHALACHVVAHLNAAAVRIALQGVLIKLGVQLTGGRIGPEQVGSLLEDAHPGVGVVGAVVAVHHGHGLAGGSGDHVNFLVDLAQLLLQHHHGEDGGTGGHVAGSGGHGIGSGHARTGVALGRGKGSAGSQQAVQPPGTLLGENAGPFTGHQHLGQHLPHFPGKVPGCQKRFQLVQHLAVKAIVLTVNGEHAGGLPYSQCVDAGEHIMDVACQGSDMANPGHMGLAVQHRLIQVGNGPSLRNVKAEFLGQPGGSLGSDGILPGAEGHQQVPVFVKGQVAVHHGGHAHGGDGLPVLKTCDGRFQTLPDLV